MQLTVTLNDVTLLSEIWEFPPQTSLTFPVVCQSAATSHGANRKQMCE